MVLCGRIVKGPSVNRKLDVPPDESRRSSARGRAHAQFHVGHSQCCLVCKCYGEMMPTSCRWEPIAQRRPQGVLTCALRVVARLPRRPSSPMSCSRSAARIGTGGAHTTSLPHTSVQPYRVEASAARIRCTVIVLTPVSAAIWRIDNPRFRSRKTRSGRTAALGLPNTFPCARARGSDLPARARTA